MKHLIFDLETTGVDVETDRIVSIAYTILDGEQEKEYYTLINPGIPIPKEASEVHGIYDDDVKDAPTFKDLSQKLYETFSASKTVISGFNSTRFDIPLLINEFARLGMDWYPMDFIDMFRIEQKLNPMSLVGVYKRRTGKDLDDAHNALADVRATKEIMALQFKELEAVPDEDPIALAVEYSGSKEVVDWAGKFKRNEQGEIVFNFGKYRGEVVGDSSDHLGFLRWMEGKDFSNNTLGLVRILIERIEAETESVF